MLSEDAVFEKEARLPWRVLAGHVVIVQIKEELVLNLNETGVELWNLIDGKRSVSDLVHYLVESFTVERATASDDVQFFLSYLRDKKVIREKVADALHR